MAAAPTDSDWPPFVTVREEDQAGRLTMALWRTCCESGEQALMTKEFWIQNDLVSAQPQCRIAWPPSP